MNGPEASLPPPEVAESERWAWRFAAGLGVLAVLGGAVVVLALRWQRDGSEDNRPAPATVAAAGAPIPGPAVSERAPAETRFAELAARESEGPLEPGEALVFAALAQDLGRTATARRLLAAHAGQGEGLEGAWALVALRQALLDRDLDAIVEWAGKVRHRDSADPLAASLLLADAIEAAVSGGRARAIATLLEDLPEDSPPPLLGAALGAWVALGDIEGIARMIKAHPDGFPPIERRLAEALLAIDQDRPADAWGSWVEAEALVRLEERDDLAPMLAAVAIRLGDDRGLVRLLDQPPERLAGWAAEPGVATGLAARLVDLGRTRELLRLVEAQRIAEPARAELGVDAAYLRLLLGEDVAGGRALLEPAWAADPSNGHVAAALLLAALRGGDLLLAERVLSSYPPESWLTLPGGARAVAGAAAWLLGEDAWATRFAESLGDERLLPEERALVSR